MIALEEMSLERLLDKIYEVGKKVDFDHSNGESTQDLKLYKREIKSQILTRFSTLEEKVKELEGWKESALLIESQWDKQKVAKLLNIGFGENIVANIEPKIVALLAEIASFKSQVEGLKCCGNCKTRHHISSCPKRKFSSSSYGSTPLSSYCEAWQSDNLTRSERNGKEK